MTNYHRLDGLNIFLFFTLISHISEGWDIQIKMQANLVSGESLLLGLQIAVFSCYPDT